MSCHLESAEEACWSPKVDRGLNPWPEEFAGAGRDPIEVHSLDYYRGGNLCVVLFDKKVNIIHLIPVRAIK